MGEFFIVVNRGQRWLVTSRGMIVLTHPDPINDLKTNGVPEIRFDDAGMNAIKQVFKNAP